MFKLNSKYKLKPVPQSAYRLGDLLVADGLLPKADLDKALQTQQCEKSHGRQVKLGRILTKNNLITRTQLMQVLLRQFKLRFWAFLLTFFVGYQQSYAQDLTLTYCCDVEVYDQAIVNGRLLASKQVLSSTPTNISSQDIRSIVDYIRGSSSIAAAWNPNVKQINSSYNIDMSSKGAVLNFRWTIN